MNYEEKQNGFIPIPILIAVVVLIGVGFWFFVGQEKGVNPVQDATQKVMDVISGGGGFNFSSDVPGAENLKKLRQGCPVKDCIPSIDNPKFESIQEADTWLDGSDIVFSVTYKGETRAYPQKILNWHELVNDEIQGGPILISFCPLCGSALAFDRKVDGQTLEFGVSGKLHNSDLVMYDRQTESLWQQITAEAIVGEHIGKKLKQISMDGMRWNQFKDQFPDAKILSRDTGFSRDYSTYPYGNYEQDASVFFPVEGGVDNTIHPKTVVYGVEINGKFKAYPENKVKDQKSNIKDNIGGIEVEVGYRNGMVNVTRADTGEEVVATRLFWFAWKSFHPDTELY